MADLVVTLTETLTLATGTISSTRAETVGSIVDAYKRIVTCPANVDTTIATFDAAISDATTCPFDIEAVKYIRVTNLDGSNSLTLSLQVEVGEDDTGADTSTSLLVEAGKSFMLGSPHDGIGAVASGSFNANLVTDLVDLDSLVVQPGSNAVDVEVYVASA